VIVISVGSAGQGTPSGWSCWPRAGSPPTVSMSDITRTGQVLMPYSFTKSSYRMFYPPARATWKYRICPSRTGLAYTRSPHVSIGSDPLCGSRPLRTRTAAASSFSASAVSHAFDNSARPHSYTVEKFITGPVGTISIPLLTPAPHHPKGTCHTKARVPCGIWVGWARVGSRDCWTRFVRTAIFWGHT
jgi:hypothetical protein